MAPSEYFTLIGLKPSIILKSIRRLRQAELGCYASKLNTETGSPARPPIIVEKLTVKLDSQPLRERLLRVEASDAPYSILDGSREIFYFSF
jgi:hypothetical protein